jgi:hypothetical protein
MSLCCIHTFAEKDPILKTKVKEKPSLLTKTKAYLCSPLSLVPVPSLDIESPSPTRDGLLTQQCNPNSVLFLYVQFNLRGVIIGNYHYGTGLSILNSAV